MAAAASAASRTLLPFCAAGPPEPCGNSALRYQSLIGTSAAAGGLRAATQLALRGAAAGGGD